MKRRLGSGRISPPAGFEPATLWSEVGSANRSAQKMSNPRINIDKICKIWSLFTQPATVSSNSDHVFQNLPFDSEIGSD